MFPEELRGPWEVAGYRVSLEFTDGVRLIASRGERRLRELPPAVRKSDDLAWLRLALQAAREHHRELRGLLEGAMVEGIPLGERDLAFLALDPIGRGMLERLVARTPTGTGRPLLDGWLLETAPGDLVSLRAPAVLVHPAALAAAGTLPEWERWLTRRWVRQPFQQVRRALYEPAAADPPTHLERVSGEVVRWDQARAILQGRGWSRVTKRSAERPWRRAGFTSVLEFRTPGARGFSREQVVLGRVYFLPLGEESASRARPGLSLEQVPAVVFSETLRDVNLAAHVAGRGKGE